MGIQRIATGTANTSNADGNHFVPIVSTVTSDPKRSGAPPPGMVITASAAPAQTKSIASVTMMSATRVTTMVSPVSAPARAPASTSRSENSSASRKLMCSIHRAATTLTRLINEPIERSIPPEMIAIAWPHAANASGSASIATDWTSNGPHGSAVVERQYMTSASRSRYTPTVQPCRRRTRLTPPPPRRDRASRAGASPRRRRRREALR